MHSRIQPLVDAAQSLSDKWTEVVTKWTNSNLPCETGYPRLHGANFNEFNKRVIATMELVRALGRVDEAGQLLFLPKVDVAATQLKNGNAAVDQLLTEFNAKTDAVWKEVGTNLDSLQGFVDGTHVANVSLGPRFDQLNGSLTALFDLVSSGLKFGKAKGLSIFLGYGEQLQQQVAAAQRLRYELTKLSDEATRMASQAKQDAEHAQTEAATAKKFNEDAKTASEATRDAQSEADAKVAVIRETAKTAAGLDAQVTAYAASFEGFQKSLDDRIEQHSIFEKAMSDAMAENKKREAEVDRLIAKSDSMIQGATTAGLGASLEETRKLYNRRMLWTGGYFFLSILLLAASAIPLVAHILPGLFAGWLPTVAPVTGALPAATGVVSGTLSSSPVNPENGTALISLLGKIFLMFPATWLTQFFSKAYTEFFHLEREYAHKAALARSVEGFKRQAPKYEEEITTAVFFEVQSNPSNQKAPDAAEHPILGPLMKKFVEALPFGKTT